MSEQARQLARVRSRIALVILQFCGNRLLAGQPEFSVVELQRYVADRECCAPASPDRVLRDLRRRGLVDYVVVSRARSRYRLGA